jgi:hypothetical protein
MAGRIDEFWSQMKDEGIAKNSHWDVRIDLPPSLSGQGWGGIEQTMKLRCESGELPGRQVVSSDIKIYGPIYRTPYQSVYTELNLTFIETADLQIRRFMEAWMDTIFDSGSNVLAYQNTFQASMTITQYQVDARPGKPADPRTEFTPEFGPNVFAGRQVAAPAGAGSSLEPSLLMFIKNAYPVNINQMATSWADDSPHRVQVAFFYEWYTMSAPNPRSTSGANSGLKESPRNITIPGGTNDPILANF